MTPGDLSDPTDLVVAADESAEDRRWMRLVDADAIDEATAEEAAFVRDYAGEGIAARAERELLRALRRRGAPTGGPSRATDDALVDAAVDRFLAARGGVAADARPSPPTPAPAPRAWRPRLLIGGGLTTAIAAAASWLLLVGPGEDVHPDSTQDAARVAVAEVEAPAPAERAPQGLALLRGEATREARAIVPGAALDDGPLALRPGACVGVGERLDACAREAAQVTIRGAAVVLDEGALAVESAGPSATTVWVEVAGAVILSDGAAAYVIAVESERWALTVARGDVRVRLDDARELVVRAGERLDGPPGDLSVETPSDIDAGAETDADADGADEAPTDAGVTRRDSLSRPSSDPRTLLAEAQALRGAGDYRGAARAYRRLIREHGDTSLARTAQVSLGQLYLGPLGAPAKAQRAFDAYLRGAPAGAMAEEALHGKIDALRRQGKDSAADAASAEFLRRFPRSSYAAGIRRQLGAP
ncbi:MAG: hypothetical protein R3A79_14825 [Nannocystaceae bacterium]